MEHFLQPAPTHYGGTRLPAGHLLSPVSPLRAWPGGRCHAVDRFFRIDPRSVEVCLLPNSRNRCDSGVGLNDRLAKPALVSLAGQGCLTRDICPTELGTFGICPWHLQGLYWF